MRFTYLIIDGLIISVPLLYSFDSRLGYYRSLLPVALSILVVGVFYIAWDVLVTRWGEWSFNPLYVTGVEVFNLPVEEVLFFVTVPYSCLFLYEAVVYFAEGRDLPLPRFLFLAVGLTLAAGSLVVSQQGYTMKAFLACAIFLFAAAFFKYDLLTSTRYWVWIAICYIPFLIFNSVLTMLPVVQYNPSAIFGVRLGTIPVEDFFYNFSMLSFYLLFYVLFKNRFGSSQRRAEGTGTIAARTPGAAARRGSGARV